MHLYQIIKICEMYFSYKTIIIFGYENQSMISLPAITFCVKKHQMIRKENLKNSSNQTEAEKTGILSKNSPIY